MQQWFDPRILLFVLQFCCFLFLAVIMSMMEEKRSQKWFIGYNLLAHDDKYDGKTKYDI